MCAILPVRMALVDESQVRLVDKGRRLQRVPGVFVAESGRRPTAQFLVDDPDQLIARRNVACTPRVEQFRDVVSRTVQIVLRVRPSCTPGRLPSSAAPRVRQSFRLAKAAPLVRKFLQVSRVNE
jgi:hypothetical protein